MYKLINYALCNFLSHSYTTYAMACTDVSVEKVKRTRKTRRICDGTLLCNLCNNGRTYSSPYALLIHQRVCTGPVAAANLACCLCKKSFANKYSLKVHSKKCNGPRAAPCFTCPACGKALSSKHNLAVHKKTCKPPASTVCDRCDKTFKSAWALQRHQVSCVTAAERMHTCTACGYETARQYMFTRHKKKCLACKCSFPQCMHFTFSNPEMLACHMRVVHNK